MQQLFLTDTEIKENLFPLAQVRPVADIRVGILTIREKWQHYLDKRVTLQVAESGGDIPEDANILSANIIPSREFADSLFKKGKLAADPAWDSVKIIQHPWHIFLWNDWAIRSDYELVTRRRRSMPLPPTVQVAGAENIFIEAGAKLAHCIINATTGPVYIGRNAEIMEGAVIRGPLALCEGAVIKMGAKVYGATTIGPYSVIGGEIKNSVIFGYSNKAHEGYLGDSVIGEWCNMGAGTSNSNVKNNAGDIKIWSETKKEMVSAGISKCGLIMGDYSRASINTAFNTGTTVGICANVFGDGLTPKFIPSFSWGSNSLSRYELEKAFVDISNWKKMKGHSLSEKEKTLLRLIFEQN